MKNDSVLLDKIKLGFGYLTDVELAGFLGVNKDIIVRIRRGEIGLSIIQRIKLMDRLCCIKVRDLIKEITPYQLAKELQRLSEKSAQHLALAETVLADGKIECDQKVIELFKQFGKEGGFSSDKDLANFLGIKRNSISMIRTGRSGLGPLPRLRMLKAIKPALDISQIEQGIESSEYLISLIDEHMAINKRKEIQQYLKENPGFADYEKLQ
jgi:transcriptional regulator with XRE-family HTH domain